MLNYGHRVRGAVIASGFDLPKEQWIYSVQRTTGFIGDFLAPYAGMYIDMRFGNDANLSAVNGINATDSPLFVIGGTDDEFYGGESPLYAKRAAITNKNCEFMLMDKPNHIGHYDYFLTDEAVAYQKNLGDDPVDKWLYMQHVLELMAQIKDFCLGAISNAD